VKIYAVHRYGVFGVLEVILLLSLGFSSWASIICTRTFEL